MLQAVTGLFDWAAVRTDGDAADLLMLGGGTLINRGFLRQVLRHDSPNVERVAFGTGVANPDYWGQPKEKPGEWIAFLESCLTVGVRGPMSAQLLVDWGLSKEPDIIGDPALSLRPGDSVEAVDGRVVVPMAGFSQSFNISVAAALTLYHVREQRTRLLGAHGDLTEAQRRVLTAVYYMRSVEQAEGILLRGADAASP